MKLLVELLDRRDTLCNILAPHAFQPERLVYLHDPGDGDRWQALRRALLRRYPAMRIEARPADCRDAAAIEAACRSLAAEGAVFELTGGDELTAAVVGRYCTEHSIPRFLFAGAPPVFTDLGGAGEYATAYRIPRLSFEDLAEAVGASVSGSMHHLPQPEQYDAIDRFFRLTLQDPSGWRQYCNYLQEITDIDHTDAAGRILVSAPETVQSSRHRSLHNDPAFALPAVRAGFLADYRVESGRVRFAYPSRAACCSMLTQGVWLEMFCYLTAQRLGWFNDCRMSVVFDWDGEQNRPGNVTNEIDVLLLREFTPLFISCKTSIPSTDDLNELLLYAKKFGGSHAKAALATTAATRQIPLATRNRAEEMGVRLLTKDRLTSQRFADFLRREFRIPDEAE